MGQVVNAYTVPIDGDVHPIQLLPNASVVHCVAVADTVQIWVLERITPVTERVTRDFTVIRPGSQVFGDATHVATLVDGSGQPWSVFELFMHPTSQKAGSR